MNKKCLTIIMAAILVAGMWGTSFAELISRGNGLIYDSDLNITYYDYSYGPVNDWVLASAWADGLEYGGYGDWRLPKMQAEVPIVPNVAESCSFKSYLNEDGEDEYDPTTADKGWNKASSELGHLFYEELDGVGFYTDSLACETENETYGLLNGTGLFQNLQTDKSYWMSTNYARGYYWNFSMNTGEQGEAVWSATRYAIAVRDGDVEQASISVTIDIKPGSCPNPLNIKGKGVLPVAILGTEGFDVTEIDLTSIRLEGVAPIRSRIKDVSTPLFEKPYGCECISEGEDGIDDLALKFDTREIVTALGEVADGDELLLTLTGTLSDGTAIEGKDCIIIRSKGKDKEKGKDKDRGKGKGK